MREYAPYIGAGIGFVIGLLILAGGWKIAFVLVLAGLGYLVGRWLIGRG